MSDTDQANNAIIMFPDFEALKSEVEKLRTEMSMLFLERDSLVYHECKNSYLWHAVAAE